MHGRGKGVAHMWCTEATSRHQTCCGRPAAISCASRSVREHLHACRNTAAALHGLPQLWQLSEQSSEGTLSPANVKGRHHQSWEAAQAVLWTRWPGAHLVNLPRPASLVDGVHHQIKHVGPATERQAGLSLLPSCISGTLEATAGQGWGVAHHPSDNTVL
jgi:hypothetical protein